MLLKRFLLTVLSTFFTISLFAQEQQPVMADLFRSNGKIYVVIGVLTIILLGIFVFLFLLERKISSLEKKINSSK